MAVEANDFDRGDAVIRVRLLELARENGVRVDRVARCESHLAGSTVYVYRLAGTSLSVSLRSRDVRHAARPDSMQRFIEPRLASLFPGTWWGQSLVLLQREVDR